jgi:hypothetical protein
LESRIERLKKRNKKILEKNPFVGNLVGLLRKGEKEAAPSASKRKASEDADRAAMEVDAASPPKKTAKERISSNLQRLEPDRQKAETAAFSSVLKDMQHNK